jgi:hypothetical protein
MIGFTNLAYEIFGLRTDKGVFSESFLGTRVLLGTFILSSIFIDEHCFIYV